MILNSQIWKQTVATAILAATDQAAWIRAIERAVKEIEKSSYWSFDGVTLTIKSTTSGKLYKITAEHTCEATQNGFKACKHKAAHRLMVRYLERLGAAQAASETKRAQSWSAERGQEVVEHKRVVISDAKGVKRIDGEIRRASMLAEAANAPLLPPTIKSETYGGIDI